MVGIHYNKRARKWRAHVKETYIGSFDTELEAIKAKEAYMLTAVRSYKRLPNRPAFSITASPCVFTMALYPTKRRTANEAKRNRLV